MRATRTNQGSIWLLGLLAALCLVLAATPAPAVAKSLKASGVKYTSANKTVKAEHWISGVGTKPATFKLSNLKIKNAKKKGYRTATFTVTFKRSWNLTEDEILDADTTFDGAESWPIEGHCWVFVVDGKTGKNLEAGYGKKKNVTMTTKWINSGRVRKTASRIESGGGEGFGWGAARASEFYAYKTKKVKYTITYPKSYKDLYIGAGMGTCSYNTKQMRKWEKGKVTYDKCWWNKHNATNTRFIRIK